MRVYIDIYVYLYTLKYILKWRASDNNHEESDNNHEEEEERLEGRKRRRLSPSRLIDARIKELSDWRGETLARIRMLIKEACPDVVERAHAPSALRRDPRALRSVVKPASSISALARPERKSTYASMRILALGSCEFRSNWPVIASEAKQSRRPPRHPLDCFVTPVGLLAMTGNDSI